MHKVTPLVRVEPAPEPKAVITGLFIDQRPVSETRPVQRAPRLLSILPNDRRTHGCHAKQQTLGGVASRARRADHRPHGMTKMPRWTCVLHVGLLDPSTSAAIYKAETSREGEVPEGPTFFKGKKKA